jgi:hypothetical protein
MDFSWVKDLAEQANKVEEDRRAQKRCETEREKQLAVSTAPFIEKLHLVVSTCAEEFNKYVHYNGGKVLTTRVQKRVKRTINEKDAELSYPEEATYFAITRKDWTYGIRGCAGQVEFIELPSGGEPLSVRLDEVGATPSRKLVAYVDETSQKIGWKQDDKVVDGQEIMSICRDYFRELIERTN